MTLASCNAAIDADVDPGTITDTSTAAAYIPVMNPETMQIVAAEVASLDYGISSGYGEAKPMVSMKSFLSNYYSLLSSAQSKFEYSVS